MTLEPFFSALIIAVFVLVPMLILIFIIYRKQKASIIDHKQTSSSEHEAQDKRIASMQRDMKKMAKALAEINQKINTQTEINKH